MSVLVKETTRPAVTGSRDVGQNRSIEIFDLIGNTAMVRIYLFREEFPKAMVCAKAEYLNPGGSLKDRPVAKILLKARERRELAEDKVILDSSSGNAGIAYAMLGGALGHAVELVIPGNASEGRLMRIRAHGANVILTDPLEGYDEALREVHRRYNKNPDAYFFADQYSNDDNWLAHYETTAQEILEQAPDLTHFICGIGTGGSISGIGRRLKEETPEVTVVSVRPERFPGIEGLKPLGEPQDVVPEILDETVIDENGDVTADEARHYCHRLAKAGHFVGQSSGAYLVGVERVLERYPDARVVTLLNDTGERYGGTGLWKD